MTQRYRHRTTGDIVEPWFTLHKGYCLRGDEPGYISFEEFHAQYEPVKEDE